MAIYAQGVILVTMSNLCVFFICFLLAPVLNYSLRSTDDSQAIGAKNVKRYYRSNNR